MSNVETSSVLDDGSSLVETENHKPPSSSGNTSGKGWTGSMKARFEHHSPLFLGLEHGLTAAWLTACTLFVGAIWISVESLIELIWFKEPSIKVLRGHLDGKCSPDWSLTFKGVDLILHLWGSFAIGSFAATLSAFRHKSKLAGIKLVFLRTIPLGTIPFVVFSIVTYYGSADRAIGLFAWPIVFASVTTAHIVRITILRRRTCGRWVKAVLRGLAFPLLASFGLGITTLYFVIGAQLVQSTAAEVILTGLVYPILGYGFKRVSASWHGQQTIGERARKQVRSSINSDNMSQEAKANLSRLRDVRGDSYIASQMFLSSPAIFTQYLIADRNAFVLSVLISMFFEVVTVLMGVRFDTKHATKVATFLEQATSGKLKAEDLRINVSSVHHGLGNRIAHSELGEKMSILIAGFMVGFFRGFSGSLATRICFVFMVEFCVDIFKSNYCQHQGVPLPFVGILLRKNKVLYSVLVVVTASASATISMLAAISTNCILETNENAM